MLLGFVSDDFFSDVRAWLVSYGRATVDRVAVDPDSLVELADDAEALNNGDAELLSMLVWTAWSQLAEDSCTDLPPSEVPSYGPTGVRVDLKDVGAVRLHFPRLAEFTGLAGIR